MINKSYQNTVFKTLRLTDIYILSSQDVYKSILIFKDILNILIAQILRKLQTFKETEV